LSAKLRLGRNKESIIILAKTIVFTIGIWWSLTSTHYQTFEEPYLAGYAAAAWFYRVSNFVESSFKSSFEYIRMKTDAYYQRQKMQRSDSSFWQYEVNADIRQASGDGRKTTVGLSTTAIFSVSLDISSVTLEIRPALLLYAVISYWRIKLNILYYYIAIRSPSSGFHWSQKCVTLNDLEWLFHVKFCFHTGKASIWDCDFRK